jgi:hypothetical protein
MIESPADHMQNALAMIQQDKVMREQQAAKEFEALLQRNRVQVQFRQIWVNGQPQQTQIVFLAQP